MWNIYIRNGIAFLPTVARSAAGFFVDIDPVEVVPICDDENLLRAIIDIVSKGNPVIPTPTRDKLAVPIVVKYAKVKSWATFEKGSQYWAIAQENGQYQIKQKRKRVDRGWEDDATKIEYLPLGISVAEVALRVVTSIRVQSSL